MGPIAGKTGFEENQAAGAGLSTGTLLTIWERPEKPYSLKYIRMVCRISRRRACRFSSGRRSGQTRRQQRRERKTISESSGIICFKGICIAIYHILQRRSMKLDRSTIVWIETAIGKIRHGEVRLIICEGIVTKILTEDHRVQERTVDEKIQHDIDL